MAVTEQRTEREKHHEENVAAREVADFKMVTFSLGGKDYGIDIMRVKEIAKFAQFTYVPNTAPYVRGVYNLRGDIISIIDLRLMFNLPAEQKPEGRPENGLILRLENNLLGIVVDSIDKVVGFSSQQIQPPHPIFGDINIKYISGVAEYDGRLYIILDVDRIFGRDEERPHKQPEEKPGVKLSDQLRSPESPVAPAPRASEPADTTEKPDRQLTRRFLQEGLGTFSSFHVSPVNESWFASRVAEWTKQRNDEKKDIQLQDEADAKSFLAPFYSRYSGNFWSDDHISALVQRMPDMDGSIVQVWNPGCGGGHESYSLAIMLKRRYPDKQIKIWAGDTDLLQISTAPNLVFREQDVPPTWKDLLVKTKDGYTFAPHIKEAILFEFSDLYNGTSMPPMDMIVCRDVVSFQPPPDQEKIFSIFDEVLKPSAVLILGDHEEPLDSTAWNRIDNSLSMYRHK